jgi:hypothetical protein
MEIKDLSKDDKYNNIANKFAEVVQAQRKLIEEINKPLSLVNRFNSFKTIESTIKELDSVNHFKNLVLQMAANSPAIEFACQANKAISGLSISPQLNSILAGINNLSEQWRKHLLSIDAISLKPSVESAALGIQSQIARFSEISILAEKSLLHINSDNLGSLISVSSEMKQIVQNSNLALSESYASLFSSLAEKELSLLSLAPEVSIFPPIDYYHNNRFWETISVPGKAGKLETTLDIELSREANDDLEKNIDLIDPELRKLWRGAKEAQRSSNPDAIRHFSISLRELLTHVIHRLSPDENIRRWSTAPEYYSQNHPTRRARLLYICRGINFGPFDDFVNKDIESVLACIDSLQKGTHAASASFTPPQLDMLLIRTESAIRLLIRAWLASKNN